MRRISFAVVCVLMLGAAPAVADDQPPQPAAEGSEQTWTQPAESVSADPSELVEKSGDSGAMTVVYAVQDGDTLRIETDEVRGAAEATDTIAAIQQQPDVVAVEIDAPRTLNALSDVAGDPSRPQQWAMDTLQAEQVWPSSTGAGVIVAVIDSGISKHPDLAGTFVPGVDLVDGGDGRNDGNGHGTHVAGIIAMTANNAIGGAGLAPGVSLMPVIVADPAGNVRAADSARGITWAVNHGANVLNMSYSGSASTVEQKAIEYAHSKGAVTVAAVGNAYLDNDGGVYNPVQYPAAYSGVLGVGAVTETLKRSSFSEVGKQVDLVAPGGSGPFDSSRGIFSTFRSGGYVRMPGTSMATPFVSASVALTIARQRMLGVAADPRDLVLATTTDLGVPGRDDEFGFGLVNPLAAVDMVNTISTTGAAIPDIQPAEITTRVVHRIKVRLGSGFLRYRIPTKGRFVVAWQRAKNKRWTEPREFAGTKKGRAWYEVRTAGGLKIRLIAFRKGPVAKSDPVWISPTFRTRTTIPGVASRT